MVEIDGLSRGWSRQDGEAGEDWLIRLEGVDRASLTFDGKLHLDTLRVMARQAAVEERAAVEAGRKKERARIAAAALAEKIRQFEDTCRSNMLIGNGATRTHFFCPKCRKSREVQINGVIH